MPAKKKITKDMILKSALNILEKKGIDSVNVKTLAKDLKCSTQPIYLSFEGMEQLREEMITVAVEQFKKAIISESEDGKVRLYSMAYINFARKQPNLFSFLFMRKNAYNEMKRILVPIIDESTKEFMKIYNITYEEADYLHDQLWMHAHGIASMIATEFCDWNMDKVKYMLDESKTTFTKKYEA